MAKMVMIAHLEPENNNTHVHNFELLMTLVCFGLKCSVFFALYTFASAKWMLIGIGETNYAVDYVLRFYRFKSGYKYLHAVTF